MDTHGYVAIVALSAVAALSVGALVWHVIATRNEAATYRATVRAIGDVERERDDFKAKAKEAEAERDDAKASATAMAEKVERARKVLYANLGKALASSPPAELSRRVDRLLEGDPAGDPPAGADHGEP